MTNEEMKVAMLMAMRGDNTSLILTPEQFKIATQMQAKEVVHKADCESLQEGIALLMDLLAD